jgi:hypothetical protein
VSQASTSALLRHFADLRDGTHGEARSRPDKERRYAAAVPLLDPYARQALGEINTDLLLGTGEVSATGVRRSANGGVEAVWGRRFPTCARWRRRRASTRAYLETMMGSPDVPPG